jgi:hypothetical protein
MVVNDKMRVLLERTDLDLVTRQDLPPGFGTVVDEGWVREPDGAWLLRALRRSYSGRRSAFTDLTGYEAAVNGRGIPDYDLPASDPERADALIRRSYSFACAALGQLDRVVNPPEMTGFISVTKTATDDPVFVANVTFWARHDGEPPYIDAGDFVTDVAAMLIDSPHRKETRK